MYILWDDVRVPRMRIDHKLPTVLSRQDIDRLLDSTDDLKYKAMLAAQGRWKEKGNGFPTVKRPSMGRSRP